MDSSVWVSIITALAGICLGPLVEMLVARWQKRPLRGLLLAVYAAVGGLIGVVAGLLIMSSSCPPGAPTSVTITSPAEGSVVGQATVVEGESCHVPARGGLWLLVLPEGTTAYYPFSPTLSRRSGHWSVSAYLGQPEEAGRAFTLLAAVTSPPADQAFDEYLARAAAEGDFPGIQPLPEGAVVYHQIDVIRR